MLSRHECALDDSKRAALTADSVVLAEEAVKKHKAFMASMGSVDERVEVVVDGMNNFSDPEAYPTERMKGRAEQIVERRDKNKEEGQTVTAMLQVRCPKIILFVRMSLCSVCMFLVLVRLGHNS